MGQLRWPATVYKLCVCVSTYVCVEHLLACVSAKMVCECFPLIYCISWQSLFVYLGKRCMTVCVCACVPGCACVCVCVCVCVCERPDGGFVHELFILPTPQDS